MLKSFFLFLLAVLAVEWGVKHRRLTVRELEKQNWFVLHPNGGGL